jgi:hypothetical protein
MLKYYADLLKQLHLEKQSTVDLNQDSKVLIVDGL